MKGLEAEDPMPSAAYKQSPASSQVRPGNSRAVGEVTGREFARGNKRWVRLTGSVRTVSLSGERPDYAAWNSRLSHANASSGRPSGTEQRQHSADVPVRMLENPETRQTKTQGVAVGVKAQVRLTVRAGSPGRLLPGPARLTP